MDESNIGEGELALRRLAGWLLPGAPDVGSVPVDRAVEVVARAGSARLLGPLLAAVDAGVLELPAAAVDEARAGHEDAMLWCLHLEVRLLEVHHRLRAVGVDHLVVKGPAVAHLDEVDASLRAFSDLDLLVRGEQLEQALAVLGAMGGRRGYVERRPGFDRRFVKSVTLTLPDAVELDVHRMLSDGTHGFRIPIDRLFDQATTFALGGERIPTLGLTHRALHAAYHGVLGSADPPLRTLRDLAAHLTSGDLPPQVLAAEAERWRGTAVLAQAVRETFATLQFEAPEWERWLADVVVDPREAAIVAAQRAESGSFGMAKVAALRELAWRDRVAYGVAVVFPTSAHLRSRGIRRGDLVRTAAARARQGITG